MKTHDYLLAIATAAFSYLFYDQNAGINFLIFDLLFLGMTIYRDPTLLKNSRWQWASGMLMCSGLGTFLHSSALAIFANCISLLLVSALSFKRKTSAAFSFVFSCYSVAISSLVILDKILRPVPRTSNGDRGRATLYIISGTAAVLLLAIMFLNLYRASNPLFAANTTWINLNFVSFSWLLFTAFGFIVVYGLYNHRTVALVESWENNLSFSNQHSEIFGSPKLQTERLGGMILFVLLNMMLVILNIGDISSLYFNVPLPEGITHSDFVHNSIETIIFSIVLATGLIMLLFRKNFASQKNNKFLKFLVCLWIVQTIVMLLSAAIRNQMYIGEFSLTHLRIGVYVWLGLAIIGLALTTDKILRERSNWFLIKNNVSVWFTIVACSSLLNWDLIITRYNISHQPLDKVDYNYLFSLADTNIPELINLSKNKRFAIVQDGTKISEGGNEFDKNLNRKIKGYIREYSDSWQSWDLQDQRITNAILDRW